ncbi:MAG: hypothetical protein ORN56_07455 [Chitinophagales bacterium]|nr:hypothetical protein [Chitinophagales bacterium]
MKKIIAIIIVLMISIFGASQAMCQKHKKKQVLQSGVVMNIPEGSTTYVIIPDSNPNQRYLVELPANFQHAGMKVEFSGAEGTIDPNVRMVGTPFRLSRIREKK